MNDGKPDILYIGTGDRGTCKARREALEHLGHNVTVINPLSYLGGVPSLLSRIEMKMRWGVAIRRFNQAILWKTMQKRFDWAWVDKGVFVFANSVRELRNRGLFVIHHLTDDYMNPHNRSRHYNRAVPHYHVHLTSNTFNVHELKDAGAKFPILTQLGFDPEFCHPGGQRPRPRQEYRTDVVFIGHWREHIDRFILPLLDAGIQLNLWGPEWHRSPNRSRLKGCCAFRIVSDEEYPVILASARIALCFLSHANRNVSTGRSFEIPAIGTFMLGERTDEHLSFYEEGKEAEFFDSPTELLKKVQYYLKNDEVRKRIAEAGYRRAWTSGYSYLDRIKSDVKNIMPIYEEWARYLKIDRLEGTWPG